MTQEDKQLLFIDLCFKFPYGIKFPYHKEEDCNHRECDCIATIDTITEETVEFTYDENGRIRDWSCLLSEVKPFLRPLSSMTEEERKEINKSYNFSDLGNITIRYHMEGWWDNDIECNLKDYLYLINWLNKHHFDYQGLIEKGLALEAPEGMYI